MNSARQTINGLMLLAVLVVATPVNAHVLRFGTLNLVPEQQHWRLSLRYAGLEEEIADIGTRLPPDCETWGKTQERYFANGVSRHSLITCTGGRAPTWVEITGLRDGARILAKFKDASESSNEAFLTATTPRFNTDHPSRERSPAAGAYFDMGIEHLLTGFDHLVFLMLVILSATTLRSTIAMATAFTLGHSLTLAASVLGVFTPEPRLVETLIALSIVVMAADVCKQYDHSSGHISNKPALSRYVWLMPAFFGLFHGMGFAGLIQATGLPAQDRLIALLLFNLGIEAGQLLFIALASLALMKATHAWRRVMTRSLVNTAGIAGGFWLVTRLF